MEPTPTSNAQAPANSKNEIRSIVFLLLALLFGIAIGTQIHWGSEGTVQRSSSTDRSVKARLDSTLAVDTTPTHSLQVEALANQHPAPVKILWLTDTLRVIDSAGMLGSYSGFVQRQALSCLDTLLWSGDTNAVASDTLKVCHNIETDSFAIDLRLATRVFRREVHFTAMDSMIRLSEATKISPKSESGSFIEYLAIFGGAALGYFFGRALR